MKEITTQSVCHHQTSFKRKNFFISQSLGKTSKSFRSGKNFIPNQHLLKWKEKKFHRLSQVTVQDPLICLPSIYSGPHRLHLHSGFIVILSMAARCFAEKHFFQTQCLRKLIWIIIVHLYLAFPCSKASFHYGWFFSNNMQLIISSILIATTEIISMSYFITINVLLVWFRT